MCLIKCFATTFASRQDKCLALNICASVLLHVCLFCVTFSSSADKRMASFITIEKDRSLPHISSARIVMKLLLKFMARTWVSILTHDRVSCDALLKV
jgi:hypothetical protein